MDNGNGRDDVYWCDLPPDEFAEEAFARMTSSAGALGVAQLGVQDILLRSQRAFYGALTWAGGPSSSVILPAGSAGQAIAFRVNQARANARAVHALVTNPALTWEATAVNTDSQSLAASKEGCETLEYLWKNNGYQGQCIGAVLGAILSGEHFLLSLWDGLGGKPTAFLEDSVQYEGDLRVDSVCSWDVFRDASAASYEGSEWLCARVPRNKWALVAQFPDRKEQILAQALRADVWGVAYTGPSPAPVGTDSIWVYYFFHRRAPQLPSGLRATMLGPDLVLEHGMLEDCYAEPLPIHRVAESDVINTPWAYSSFWDILALQALYSDIHSSIGSNIHALGKQLISTEADQNTPVTQLSDGPTLIERPKGTAPPVALQLTAQPPSAFEHLAKLEQVMRNIVGLNDFVVGQPDSTEMNASFGALMVSLAIQQNSDFQKRYLKFVSDFGRSMLKIFRTHASQPRKLAISGKHGTISKEFSSETLASLDDVFVTIGSPLTQSTYGRTALAEMLIEKGIISTVEEFLEVVESGNLDPLTQGLQAELLYIAEENEQLLEGVLPPVKITDSHQLHVREHRATTFSQQSRANAQVNVVTDEHIKQHLDFLMNTDPMLLAVMGQAAPAPAMPPGGPAPGGGAGGAEKVEKVLGNPVPGPPDIEPAQAPPDPATGRAFNLAGAPQ